MATKPTTRSSHRDLTAAERTARLLGLLPWVAARGGASIDEIESRFDYPRKILLADLTALIDENELLDGHNVFSVVSIDWMLGDDYVQVRCPKWMLAPMRLNSDEAARLLTVGRAVLSLNTDTDTDPDPDTDFGTGPGEDTEIFTLTRALIKLQLMLDDAKRGLNTRHKYTERVEKGEFDANTDISIEVNLGNAKKTTLNELRRAVDEHKQLTIEYYSYGRDVISARTVDPVLVYSHSGRWYLSAWCHTAADMRNFRVDRILDHRVSGDVTDIRTIDNPTPIALTGDDLTEDDLVVTLILNHEGRWAAEHYPILERRELDDGRLEIKMVVKELTWLARVLVQLGPQAEIVSNDSAIEDLRATAAARILERYR